MRFLPAIGLTVLMLTGCTKSEPVMETATAVQTAPPTIDRPDTGPAFVTSPPTAPPTTAPPPSGPTTIPVDAAGSTIVNGAVITEDEAAIKLVVEKVTIADFTGRYNEAFDPSPFKGLIGDDYLQSLETSFNQRRNQNEIRRPGTTLQVITHRIKFTAKDRANAVTCNRNDIQVWDTKGTANNSDDVLLDGSLGVIAEGKMFSKVEGKWIIESATKIGDSWCASVF
jgi:hypothetical protein